MFTTPCGVAVNSEIQNQTAVTQPVNTVTQPFFTTLFKKRGRPRKGEPKAHCERGEPKANHAVKDGTLNGEPKAKPAITTPPAVPAPAQFIQPADHPLPGEPTIVATYLYPDGTSWTRVLDRELLYLPETIALLVCDKTIFDDATVRELAAACAARIAGLDYIPAEDGGYAAANRSSTNYVC